MTLRKLLNTSDAHNKSVERERRERVSQLAWCGGGCFDSRRPVNSTVGQPLAPYYVNVMASYAKMSPQARAIAYIAFERYFVWCELMRHAAETPPQLQDDESPSRLNVLR